MKNVQDFVIDYIQRKNAIPHDVDIINLNFVEEGYIDSLGLIQFIYMLENEFNVSLGDLQNPEIKVVGKIIALIESKMQTAKERTENNI